MDDETFEGIVAVIYAVVMIAIAVWFGHFVYSVIRALY